MDNGSSLWFVIIFALALVAVVLAYFLLKIRAQKKAEVTRNLELESRISDLAFEHQLLMSAQETILLVIDQQSEITFTNDAAKDFLNRSDPKGKSYQDCVIQPEVVSIIDEAIQTGEPIEKDLYLTLESSIYSAEEERFLNIKIQHFSDPNYGNHTRVIIQDVTERERNEMIRKDFVANASHELRTPLAIINGYVETLMDKEVLSDIETSQYFLNIMQRHGHRLARIIEEMLMITKLESGVNNTLNREPFRVRDCIDDCLSNLDQLINERDVKIKVKMGNPDLMIDADRFYLSQILFNLVENAIKQNPDEPIRINIGAAQCRENQRIKIWVSDNGKGIPSADLPFIFRRFYRVAKDHSQQKIKGTGLGLSIVKRAVEAHEGSIKCDSIENVITRFVITLPP